MQRTAAVLLVLSALTTTVSSQTPTARTRPAEDVETQRIKPFQAFDNVYFVGVKPASAWVVKTDRGLILIDTLWEPYANLLVENIKALGLNPAEIKYIIGTHAHYDHTGNAAWLQQEFGARLAMADKDWDMIAASKQKQPRRDIVYKDGDTLTLGNTTLKFYEMPSHTPGVLGIELTVFDAGQPYKAFVQPPVESTGAKDDVATLARLEQMENQGFMVNLWVHPIMDRSFYQRVEKLAQRKAGEPNPFVDPNGFHERVEQLKARAKK